MSPVAPGDAPDKHLAVQQMFGRIAGRYDLMNLLMSGGLDRFWRRRTAIAAALPAGGLALDVGTGTGDLAFELARSAPGARVIGLDYTAAMLARAPGKAVAQALSARTGWVRGDGQRLPFADGTFDAVTSAFVLRNFADLGGALVEMARVVKPGGRVVALEISPGLKAPWDVPFRLYFGRIVPLVGGWISGDAAAYRYLPASVDAFLRPSEIARLLEEAGLTALPPRRLMRGGVVIHAGVKAFSAGSTPVPAGRSTERGGVG
jgi:demethylmenaquinone methyltransferase/2-methoxy-6-polyprenyl-1,4-benzoquinol methylase